MKSAIVHDQPLFERWLVEETSVFARMVQKIDNGESQQTGIGADMTQWRFIFLLETLSRYADRDQADLKPVAHDYDALWGIVRNGPSLQAKSQARVDKLMREGKP